MKSLSKLFFSFFESKNLIRATILVICAESAYYLMKIILHKRLINTKKDKDQIDALFFPDAKVACRKYFIDRIGCTSPLCKFSHDESLSYAKLLKALNSSQHTLDVCVFCFTAEDICKILESCLLRGVKVRVLTDSEQITSTNSMIQNLRRTGDNYFSVFALIYHSSLHSYPYFCRLQASRFGVTRRHF